MGNRSKYKHISDLYIQGVELILKDNSVMWIQQLNPFEEEEVRKDASAALARFTLAMKEIGSPEYTVAKSYFSSKSKEEIVEEILSTKSTEFNRKCLESIQDDPDWKERLEIIERSADLTPLEDGPEKELFEKVNMECNQEFLKRFNEERDSNRGYLLAMSSKKLEETYFEEWVKLYGNGQAKTEHELSQMYYSVRVCDAGVPVEGSFGQAAHKECDHRDKVFEDKKEVRELPAELYLAILEKMNELSVSVREVKN